MYYNFRLSLIWILIGLISFIIGRYFRQSKFTKRSSPFVVEVPKRVSQLLGEAEDTYSISFQIGGAILVIISVFVGFIKNDSNLSYIVWLSFILYSVIPGWLIRRWKRDRNSDRLQ
jgi:hypothetical protein